MQNHHMTKSSWWANHKRLYVEFELLEKNYKLPSNVSDLIKPELNLITSSRVDNKQLVVKRLSNFKAMLQSIQSKVRNESILINKKVLQEQLESFENKLTAFKMLMKAEFDSFDEKVAIYDAEICNLNSSLETWDYSDFDGGAIVDEVPPETIKRLGDMQQQDMDRKATIGALDRQVIVMILERYNSVVTNDCLSCCQIASLEKSLNWDPRDQDVFVRTWYQVLDKKQLFETELINTDDAEGGFDYLNLSSAPKKSLLLKKLSTAMPWKLEKEIESHIQM